MKTALLCLLSLMTGLATAQNVVFEAVKTKEGCEVRVPGPRPKLFGGIDAQGRQLPPPKEEWSWSGACVGGTAFGPGTLKTRFPGPGQITEFKQLTLDGGFPVGYEYTWIEQQDTPGRTMTRVMFWSDGRGVSFSQGWGLDTTAFSSGVSRVTEPRLVPVQPTAELGSGLSAPSGMVMLSNMMKFPISSSGEMQTVDNWELREMPQGVGFQNARVTPCPVPTDAQSCRSLAEAAAAPLREEVLAFIRQAKPAVDAAYARIHQALAATGSAATTPAAGAAAPAAMPAARSDVNVLPVGALFAAADEAASRGDRAGAREALRALLRRFPDHPLAARAATQLSSLQGP